MKTSSGISKAIAKKTSPAQRTATGFAGEHSIPANTSFSEEDAALKEMTEDIEAQIATGTLSSSQVRSLRNRLSAARSRFRKRHFLALLEGQIAKLEAEKANLREELASQKKATDAAARDAANLRSVLASLITDNQAVKAAPVAPVSSISAVAPMQAPVGGFMSTLAPVAAPAFPSPPAPPVRLMSADSAPVVSAAPSGSPASLAPRLTAPPAPSAVEAPPAPLALKAPGSPLLDILLSDWASTSPVEEVKHENAVPGSLPSPPAQWAGLTGDDSAWLSAQLDSATM